MAAPQESSISNNLQMKKVIPQITRYEQWGIFNAFGVCVKYYPTRNAARDAKHENQVVRQCKIVITPSNLWTGKK